MSEREIGFALRKINRRQRNEYAVQASFHGLKLPVEEETTERTASPFSVEDMRRAMERSLSRKQISNPDFAQNAPQGASNEGA